jgi:hypothetical protein
MIGIGVTTTLNRRNIMYEWLKHYNQYAPETAKVHIHLDIERKGIAYSKNENLFNLKDCEHIFLFDDDCHPISNDWYDYFIESNEEHLLYLNSTHKLIHEENNVEHYENCGGVFMYISKKAFETVGYFELKYGLYGFEHASYSQRIFKAGLTKTPYQQLKNTDKYLYAYDYNPECIHKSSITEQDKAQSIASNMHLFQESKNNGQIFFNYNQ